MMGSLVLERPISINPPHTLPPGSEVHSSPETATSYRTAASEELSPLLPNCKLSMLVSSESGNYRNIRKLKRSRPSLPQSFLNVTSETSDVNGIHVISPTSPVASPSIYSMTSPIAPSLDEFGTNYQNCRQETTIEDFNDRFERAFLEQDAADTFTLHSSYGHLEGLVSPLHTSDSAITDINHILHLYALQSATLSISNRISEEDIGEGRHNAYTFNSQRAIKRKQASSQENDNQLIVQDLSNSIGHNKQGLPLPERQLKTKQSKASFLTSSSQKSLQSTKETTRLLEISNSISKDFASSTNNSNEEIPLKDYRAIKSLKKPMSFSQHSVRSKPRPPSLDLSSVSSMDRFISNSKDKNHKKPLSGRSRTLKKLKSRKTVDNENGVKIPKRKKSIVEYVSGIKTSLANHDNDYIKQVEGDVLPMEQEPNKDEKSKSADSISIHHRSNFSESKESYKQGVVHPLEKELSRRYAAEYTDPMKATDRISSTPDSQEKLIPKDSDKNHGVKKVLLRSMKSIKNLKNTT